VVRLDQTTYGFIGSPGNSIPPKEYAITDGVMGSFQPSVLDSGLFVIAAASNSGMLDVAGAHINGTDPLQLLVGQFDTNHAANVTGGFNVALQLGSLQDAPLGNRPLFNHGSFLLLGPKGAAPNELWLLWTDVAGNQRYFGKVATVPGRIRSASLSARDSNLSFGGKVHVGWIETYADPDGGPDYDVLFYNMLNCL